MSFMNRMFTVALAAFSPVMLIESLLVFAPVKKTCVSGVTNTATATHTRHPWRAGGVVSVTVIASRSTEIASPKQSLTMNTLAIFRELSGRHG